VEEGDAMPTYLIVYHGGGLPVEPQRRATEMERWMAWFRELGPVVLDKGNPASTMRTIRPDGSVTDPGSVAGGGYLMIEAVDIDEAVHRCRDCPPLALGATVDVIETYEPD
jgi:hypothetical protein